MNNSNIKISIITVVKNGMPYLKNCLKSFQSQNYENKEHIIICSKSSDNTLKFLNTVKYKNTKIYFENKNMNLYEALNFASKKIGGNLIGYLHADDIFYNKSVLKNVVSEFNNNDIVYGNIIITKKNNIKNPFRVWKNLEINKFKKKFLITPPHTGVFYKEKIIKKIKYNTNYNISSDYDFLIKIFFKNKFKKKYLNKFLIIMRHGGLSTNLNSFTKKMYEDIKILSYHKKNFLIFYIIKLIYKFAQLFIKR